MLLVALVPTLIRQIGDVLRAAGRALDDAIGPANRFDGLTAVFVDGKEQNRFPESFRSGVGGHE